MTLRALNILSVAPDTGQGSRKASGISLVRVRADGLGEPAEPERRSGVVLHTSQFNDCNLRSPKCCAEQPHSREVQAALGTFNDCGGTDGDVRRRALAGGNPCGEPIAGWKHRPANSRFDSGPQSPNAQTLGSATTSRAGAVALKRPESGSFLSINSGPAIGVALTLAAALLVYGGAIAIALQLGGAQ